MTERYEVFARINEGDDLIHIGNVSAPNDRLARTYAHNTFDEEDWADMFVVRSADLIDVSPGAVVG